MKMKRLVAVLASAILTAGVLVGCGSSATKENEGGASTGEGKKSEIMIGLATDEGGLNDKSFNQSADEGVKKAVEEFGVEYKPIESKKKEDYEPNLQALVDAGSDLTFAIGFQLDKATESAAKNNPESKFAIIDATVDAPNVTSITFKEEEGSFLMGVIAGKMTKTNQVGFIGGKDFDTIQKFESGFVAGVKAVNPEAGKLLESPDGKKAGKNVKYADSFDDTNKGYELAKALYDSGCDVIYHSAGGVGIGMFKATQELKDAGKEVWAIGVDKDQAAEKDLQKYAGVILSSMIKRVDVATYDSTKAVVNNEFKAGHIELGLKDGGVGIAETTEKNTPKEVIDLAKDYEQKIIKGEIKAPATREEAKNFK